MKAVIILIGPDREVRSDGAFDGTLNDQGTIVPGNSPGTITIINVDPTTVELEGTDPLLDDPRFHTLLQRMSPQP